MEKQLQKGRQQLEELVSGGKRNFERNWGEGGFFDRLKGRGVKDFGAAQKRMLEAKRAGQAKIEDELADNPFLKRIRKVAERLQKNVGETYDFDVKVAKSAYDAAAEAYPKIDPFTPAYFMRKVGEGIIDFTSELYNAPGFAGKVSTILSAPGRAADKLEEFVDYFRSIDIPYEKALEAAKEFVNLDPVAWKEATQGSLGGDTDYKSTKLRYDRIVQKRRDAGEDVSLAAGAEKIVDELNDLGLVKYTSEFLRKPEVRQVAHDFGESLQSQEKSIAFAKEYGADPEEVDKKTELFAPGVRILAQIAEGTGDVEVPGTTSKAPAPPAPAPAPPWMVGGGASQVAPGLQAAIPDIAAGGPDVSGFTDRTNAMVDELHAPAPGTAKQPFMDNQMAQALISAGGSMMRSQSPTFLGGLGEGVGAGQAMYHKVGAALAKQAADKAAAASKAYNAQSTRMMAEAQMKTADANVAKYKGKKVKKSMIDELGRLVYTYEGGQKPEIQEGIRFTTGIEKEMFKVAAESVGDILNDLPPEQIADRLIAITNRMLEAKGMPPMQPRQKGINRVSSDKLLPYRK
jgi:flavodoxin